MVTRAWLRLATGLVLCAVFFVARPASAAPVQLGIRIVHAHSRMTMVDPRIAELAKDFAKLKFTAYELKDEAAFSLELGSTGRMQLPSKDWMFVRPVALGEDGKLRLELVVERLKFRSTVVIAPQGTLAVGGPAYDDGSLILAVTRDVAASAPK